MSKKARNKRRRNQVRAASSPQASQAAPQPSTSPAPQPPAPKREFKTLSASDIDPRAWKVAQELEDLTRIPALQRTSGSGLKREQQFRSNLSKVPYRHFTAALARLRRGESPPS